MADINKLKVNLWGLDEVKSLQEQHQIFANEIDKLAEYILLEHPEEIGKNGRNESAVDVAIRMLKEHTEK